MAEDSVTRRLAAILAADVVDYSRLMAEDEAGTLAALKAHREELVDPAIAGHHGRIVKLMGDGALVEFASVVDAVHCAVEIQRAMPERNTAVPEDRRMAFRIGINLGDVILDSDDIYGDGVNVAARLEGLAEPGGICVSQSVRNEVRDKLPVDFEDLGEQIVKNIPRPVRAFRIVSELQDTVSESGLTAAGRRRWAIASIAAAALLGGAAIWAVTQHQMAPPDAQPLQKAPVLAEQPSIAVLPFANMSGEADQDYFSDGITDDLITDLSRISGLFVIARNSVFTYKGRPVKVQQVGRELGVRYVLEGSVRKVGNRVRINTQLIDAGNGHHLWAQRYDRELTDVFALQDEVTQKIVSALAITLTPGEQERLSRAAEANPEAYDMLLRGLEQFRRFTRETNAEARGYFERAVALDPRYARAHAALALTQAMDVAFAWTDSRERALEQGLRHGKEALRLDDSVRQVHFALSNVYLQQRRHADAIAAARRALELEPSYADGYAILAQTLNYAGQPAEGLEAIQNAMRLNPYPPFFYLWIEGHSYFLMGRYEHAVSRIEQVAERNPHFPPGHLALAAAYGQAGRIDDAEWEAEEVLTLFPDFSLARERQRVPYKNAADLERYLEGLRKSGLK